MSPDDFLSDYFTLIRGINICLSLALVIMIGYRYLKYTEVIRLRLLRLGLIGLLLSNAYSAIELTLRGVPGGPRGIPTLISLVWLVFAFFYGDWPGQRKLAKFKRRNRPKDQDPLDDAA